MALSIREINEILDRYPEQKPTVFNYMHAREDVRRLIDEYKKMKEENMMITKKFIVLIDSAYVRDSQVFSGDYFINKENNLSDYDSAWEDYDASMVIGEFKGCCAEQAIDKAADETGINQRKLTAYQIVD